MHECFVIYLNCGVESVPDRVKRDTGWRSVAAVLNINAPNLLQVGNCKQYNTLKTKNIYRRSRPFSFSVHERKQRVSFLNPLQTSASENYGTVNTHIIAIVTSNGRYIKTSPHLPKSKLHAVRSWKLWKMEELITKMQQNSKYFQDNRNRWE